MALIPAHPDTKKSLMRGYLQMALVGHITGDLERRNFNSNEWRKLATEQQAKEAPRFLTWAGRQQ